MAYIINGMRELLAEGMNLPTLPAVVRQLHQALDDTRAGAADLARIIERDPALTARLLRATNSAATRGEREPMGSVPGAVTRLGVSQVRTACIAEALGPRPSRALDQVGFRVHCVSVALTARELWQRFGTGQTVTGDDVYVSGLLHDAGLLVLEQYFPKEYAAVMRARGREGGRLWQHEEARLGMDHGAVGGLLLGRWSLPPAIAEAVTNHHHPHQAGEAYQHLARVIQAAEVLCTDLGAGLEEEGAADCSPADVLGELGAGEGEVTWFAEWVPQTAAAVRRALT